MANKLNIPVLVLNKGWSPVHCTTVEKAIGDLSIEKVTAIDPVSYIAYPWVSNEAEGVTGWMDLPVIGDMPFLQLTRGRQIRLPRIIVTTEYNKIPNFSVKLNIKNLWIRDGGRCQYTGRKLTLNEATKDHVVPQSKGGLDTWENLVTCCPIVNRNKGNKTNEQAGLKLLSKPYAPKWSPLYSSMFSSPTIPDDFKPFLKIKDEHARLYAEMHGG